VASLDPLPSHIPLSPDAWRRGIRVLRWLGTFTADAPSYLAARAELRRQVREAGGNLVLCYEMQVCIDETPRRWVATGTGVEMVDLEA